MNDFVFTPTRTALDSGTQQLLQQAEQSLDQAYAPYSQFAVAAAVLLDNGTIITGTNQENAVYPSGLCAERVALFTLAAVQPGATIKKLVVVARRSGDTELTPATCCGGCRQVMLEFEQRQARPFQVVMLSQEHQWVTAPSAQSLLPFCFTAAALRPAKIS